MVSLPAPPCTTVRPPWSATVVVPKSGPACAVPLIVTWSAPPPSSRFTTSTLVFTACVVRVSPTMRNEPHVMPAGASDGVSLASSSVNVPPVVALSSKTLSTSICSDSGGTGVIARWLRLSSPGNSKRGEQRAVGAAVAAFDCQRTVERADEVRALRERRGVAGRERRGRLRTRRRSTFTTSLPSPAITVVATPVALSRARRRCRRPRGRRRRRVRPRRGWSCGRAVDLQTVDHEVVGQFSRDDCGEVGACAAVDRHARVGRVLREPADQRGRDHAGGVAGVRVAGGGRGRASANERSVKRSSPASPSNVTGARLAYTTNSSLPLPPTARMSRELPLLSQPRVVGVVAKTSAAARLAAATVRGLPYNWPMMNASLPSPPSNSTSALLSSLANVSGRRGRARTGRRPRRRCRRRS